MSMDGRTREAKKIEEEKSKAQHVGQDSVQSASLLKNYVAGVGRASQHIFNLHLIYFNLLNFLYWYRHCNMFILYNELL